MQAVDLHRKEEAAWYIVISHFLYVVGDEAIDKVLCRTVLSASGDLSERMARHGE